MAAWRKKKTTLKTDICNHTFRGDFLKDYFHSEKKTASVTMMENFIRRKLPALLFSSAVQCSCQSSRRAWRFYGF